MAKRQAGRAPVERPARASSSSSSGAPSTLRVPSALDKHKAQLYDFEQEFTPKTAVEEDEIQREIEDQLVSNMKLETRKRTVKQSLIFTEVLPLIRSGVQSLAKDDFTVCFESKKPSRWNHTLILWIMWVVGVAMRFCILLPIKVTIFLVGTLLFLLGMLVVCQLKDGSRKRNWMRKLIQFWSHVWITSWFGVVRYHGVYPVHKLNHIYVSNHASLIDFVVLLGFMPFATVGQQHVGFIAVLQNMISSLGNIWFNRFESKDRTAVSRRLKEHIMDPENPPLLIFPEGVCVNNEHVVMFRKGAFDIGATVCPITIRYNKKWVDPYWNSKNESFLFHIYRIMSSWCLEADVYFLEPQNIKPGEDSADFANRVQKMVAKKGGMRTCPWDGYLKYFKPNPRFKEKRQKMFAEVLLKNWEADESGIPRGASLGDLAGLDVEGDSKEEFAHRFSSREEPPTASPEDSGEEDEKDEQQESPAGPLLQEAALPARSSGGTRHRRVGEEAH